MGFGGRLGTEGQQSEEQRQHAAGQATPERNQRSWGLVPGAAVMAYLIER